MESQNSTTLTASQMIEYLFCHRFTYFEYVLGIPQNEGNRFKVEKGRDVHEVARNRNVNYLRKKLNAIKKKSDVYLSSPIGIRGIIDEILFFDDGTAAPLDYKYAEYKEKLFSTYKYQLVFYAQLIKDNYDIPVKSGFIVYTRSKNKLLEIKIGNKEYIDLNKIISDMLDIIERCKYPKPTSYKKRCLDCCYKNICEKSI